MSKHNKANYAQIKPLGHDPRALQRTMKRRYAGELATLNAVNDLASEPYGSIVSEQRRWTVIKYLALFVSFIGLLITLLINYASPMITQEKYGFDDPRVYLLLGTFVLVALAATAVIDLGRTWVLRSSNNGAFAWGFFAFMTLFSLSLTTTGNLAVADYFESKSNATTTDAIAKAKQYMIDNAGAGSMTMAQLDAKAQKNEIDYKQIQGGGYPSSTYNRIKREVATDRERLRKYLNAKATVEGKAAIQATDESSNWLFNVVAKIGGYSSVIKAGIIISLLFNIALEIMSAYGQGRLVKLNARLEVTDRQWGAAEMAANKASMVDSSRLQPLNELDVFQHNFGMPIPLLDQYRANGKSVGDFIPEVKVYPQDHKDSDCKGTADCNCDTCSDKQTPKLTQKKSNSADRKLELYAVAKKAKSGSTFLCPNCETDVIKRGNKVFCTNSKNKHSDGTNCSDDYHNAVNPDRKKYLLKHSKA